MNEKKHRNLAFRFVRPCPRVAENGNASGKGCGKCVGVAAPIFLKRTAKSRAPEQKVQVTMAVDVRRGDVFVSSHELLAPLWRCVVVGTRTEQLQRALLMFPRPRSSRRRKR